MPLALAKFKGGATGETKTAYGKTYYGFEKPSVAVSDIPARLSDGISSAV